MELPPAPPDNLTGLLLAPNLRTTECGGVYSSSERRRAADSTVGNRITTALDEARDM